MAKYDLLVIGGGTGGYSAALRAAENKLSVAIVEKDKLGGTCLHRGCIPTKALIEASNQFYKTQNSSSFGINLSNLSIDWNRIQNYKSDVVNKLHLGLSNLIKARKIEVIHGEAKFRSSNSITVDGSVIEADNIVIAVGAHPKEINTLPRSKRILNSDQLLEIDELPKSLIIVGGGYIGIEFASLFNQLGSKVTVIEMAEDILLNSDIELRQSLANLIRERGVAIEVKTRIKSIEANKDTLSVTTSNENKTTTYEAALLLVSIGRKASTQNLGLENTKVKINNNSFVEVDNNLKTNDPNIYAIGDCINTPQLAHVSFAEGIAVADYIANKEALFPDYNSIPSIIYSNPQLASVGLTQEKAKKNNIKTKTANFNFNANSMAAIRKEKEGAVKIITDEKDNILGIHILGSDASELISEAMLAVGWEAKIDDLANYIHPHPTFSEAIGEAALKLSGKPLHSL